MAAVASLSKQLCSVGGVQMLSAVEQAVPRSVVLPVRLSQVHIRKAMSFRAPSIALGTSFLGGPAWQVRWMHLARCTVCPRRLDKERVPVSACMHAGQKHCLPMTGFQYNAAHGPAAQTHIDQLRCSS